MKHKEYFTFELLSWCWNSTAASSLLILMHTILKRAEISNNLVFDAPRSSTQMTKIAPKWCRNNFASLTAKIMTDSRQIQLTISSSSINYDQTRGQPLATMNNETNGAVEIVSKLVTRITYTFIC